jgi:hypothetical protein
MVCPFFKDNYDSCDWYALCVGRIMYPVFGVYEYEKYVVCMSCV